MIGLTAFALMLVIGIITSIIGLAIIIYTLYDIILKQDKLAGLEKLIWVLIILVLNLAGAIIYLVFKHTSNLEFLEKRQKDLEELEKLKQLRDEEAITEEEYQELKQEIIKEMES